MKYKTEAVTMNNEINYNDFDIEKTIVPLNIYLDHTKWSCYPRKFKNFSNFEQAAFFIFKPVFLIKAHLRTL